MRACNCCASKGADDLLGVVEVDEANIILTAILAFSAIKLLFCSLLAASEAVSHRRNDKSQGRIYLAYC